MIKYLMVFLFAINIMIASAVAAESSITQIRTGSDMVFAYTYIVQPGESVTTGLVPTWMNRDLAVNTVIVSAESSANVTMDVDAIALYTSKPPEDAYEVAAGADIVSFSDAASPAYAAGDFSFPHLSKFKINNTGLAEVSGVISYAIDPTTDSAVSESKSAPYDQRRIFVVREEFSLDAAATQEFGPFDVSDSSAAYLYTNVSATGLTFGSAVSHLKDGPYTSFTGTTAITGPGQALTASGVGGDASRWGKIKITNPTGGTITGEITIVKGTH